MEKLLFPYEAMFIVKPDLTPEAQEATVNKFATLVKDNGTIISQDEWGKRRLSYPIENYTEGYYVLLTFRSESSLPLELDRIFGITDTVLRSMIIKLDERNLKEEKVTAPAESPKETE